MVGQPLQDSGLLYYQYFCSAVFLMNCKEKLYDLFLHQFLNVPRFVVQKIICD